MTGFKKRVFNDEAAVHATVPGSAQYLTLARRHVTDDLGRLLVARRRQVSPYGGMPIRIGGGSRQRFQRLERVIGKGPIVAAVDVCVVAEVVGPLLATGQQQVALLLEQRADEGRDYLGLYRGMCGQIAAAGAGHPVFMHPVAHGHEAWARCVRPWFAGRCAVDGTGVAAVGNEQQHNPRLALGEYDPDFVVVEGSAPGLYIIRAEGLVQTVDLVAVYVGLIGAMSGVGNDQGITVFPAGDQLGHGLDHSGLGGLGIQQGPNAKTVRLKSLGPAVGVVDAAGQIHVRTGVVVDAYAECFIAYDVVSWILKKDARLARGPLLGLLCFANASFWLDTRRAQLCRVRGAYGPLTGIGFQ